jgi:hypothetical protein
VLVGRRTDSPDPAHACLRHSVEDRRPTYCPHHRVGLDEHVLQFQGFRADRGGGKADNAFIDDREARPSLTERSWRPTSQLRVGEQVRSIAQGWRNRDRRYTSRRMSASACSASRVSTTAATQPGALRVVDGCR